ncbi:MAG: hypothetical protein MZU91_06855 [Desulfosudis oleivorans]|nr:hypothetical protein [Desulfosudis oleivorans]
MHDGEKITGVHGRVVLDGGCAFHSVDIAAKAVVLAAGALHTPALQRARPGSAASRSGATSSSTCASAPSASSRKSSTPSTAIPPEPATVTTTSARGSCWRPPSPARPAECPALSASARHFGTSSKTTATWPCVRRHDLGKGRRPGSAPTAMATRSRAFSVTESDAETLRNAMIIAEPHPVHGRRRARW